MHIRFANGIVAHIERSGIGGVMVTFTDGSLNMIEIMTPDKAREFAAGLFTMAHVVDGRGINEDGTLMSLVHETISTIAARFGINEDALFNGDDAPLVELDKALAAWLASDKRQIGELANAINMGVTVHAINTNQQEISDADRNVSAIEKIAYHYAAAFGEPSPFGDITKISVADAAIIAAAALHRFAAANHPAPRTSRPDGTDYIDRWIAYAVAHGDNALDAALLVAYFAFEWDLHPQDVALTMLSMTPEANDHGSAAQQTDDLIAALDESPGEFAAGFTEQHMTPEQQIALDAVGNVRADATWEMRGFQALMTLYQEYRGTNAYMATGEHVRDVMRELANAGYAGPFTLRYDLLGALFDREAMMGRKPRGVLLQIAAFACDLGYNFQEMALIILSTATTEYTPQTIRAAVALYQHRRDYVSLRIATQGNDAELSDADIESFTHAVREAAAEYGLDDEYGITPPNQG